MKITEIDIVGQIEGFPIEIVKKMMQKQKEQGNAPSLAVFIRNRTAGFMFHKTSEGFDFWQKVIVLKDFDTFYNKYPKKKTNK